MMCHIIHTLNFPVGLYGPFGDLLQAGFGPCARVCAPLLYPDIVVTPAL